MPQDRELDTQTQLYWYGLHAGMFDLAFGVHGLGRTSRVSAYNEGYRDALDDSDDMPEPFDPEETLVP